LLARYPDTLDALVIRIGSSVALGRTEDAQRSAEVLRHHHPGFRVDAFATTQPYMDPAQLERVTRALRNAGLE
jgi:hypothetical protein